jgi:hypothetical protein
VESAITDPVRQLRASRYFPTEKFLIFTQYRETQEFLWDEMSKLYGVDKISLLHGGPLEDKIEAAERFWDENGAQFLISTSAGGEGINLQVCRVMFNYDLPWNPMAVEQRIGRIHRYGQQDTVQVYNLVAQDTVEERIYFLLEEKLLEIARTIGKVDEHGEVVEDFRLEILGFLGSSPNYQELYKRALVDRDYKRTATEIAEAMEKAKLASEALRALTQDLETFNLDHCRQLQGQFSLQDLKLLVEKAIVRLGGTFIPAAQDVFRIDTPFALREFTGVAAKYDAATFSRDLAVRRRKVEFLGLGHPLVDALITYLKSPRWRGSVSSIHGTNGIASVRWFVSMQTADGKVKHYYRNIGVNGLGSIHSIDARSDLLALQAAANSVSAKPTPIQKARECAEGHLGYLLGELRGSTEAVSAIRPDLVGLALTS